MSETGKLGLLRFPQEERHWLFLKRTEAPEIVAQIVERLNLDTRTARLNGRLLAIGNGGTSYSPESLAAWWLWRANEVGRDQADNELNNYLDSEKVECWSCQWIHGVSVTSPLYITEDVQLIPWQMASPSVQWIATARENHSFPRTCTNPTALLVQSTAVARDFDPHADREPYWPDYTLMTDVIHLMNLAPGICAVPGPSSFELAPHVPPGAFAGFSWGANHLEIRPLQPTIFSEQPDLAFGSLVRRFEEFSVAKKEKWRRILKRLSQAKARIDIQDMSLDLGIALEMLLLDGKPEQLSLAFRQRGAWLIGRNLEDRMAVHDTLSLIYKLRSEVAHTGHSKTLQGKLASEVTTMRQKHLELAERISRKLLLADQVDWNLVTLGSE